jgi:hypothetical protein
LLWQQWRGLQDDMEQAFCFFEKRTTEFLKLISPEEFWQRFEGSRSR